MQRFPSKMRWFRICEALSIPPQETYWTYALGMNLLESFPNEKQGGVCRAVVMAFVEAQRHHPFLRLYGDSLARRFLHVLSLCPPCAILSASSGNRFFTSHSQITITCQPAASSAACSFLSRATLRSNLACQNSTLDLGIVAVLHPSCRCQKQPLTKMTVCHFGSTMSGCPGSLDE